MKLFLSLFLLLAVSTFGATPDYKAFRGTGGITVVTNPPTGTIVIDGSGVTLGTNAAAPPFSSVQFNSNGVLRGSSSFVFTNGSVGIGTIAPVAGSSLTLEGGHLLFKTPNTYDIGAAGGANTPRSIFAGMNINAGTHGFMGSSLLVGVNDPSGFLGHNSRGYITFVGDGVWQFSDNAATSFNHFTLGGTTAAFPAIGRTNGHLAIIGANGAFDGSNTNGLWLMGGGIIQDFSFTAPMAPSRQGAVYWNDGTNVCVVLRNSAGTLTTNKLSMTAWP